MKVLLSELNQSKANKVNSHLCERVAVGVAMACGYNPPGILDFNIHFSLNIPLVDKIIHSKEMFL